MRDVLVVGGGPVGLLLAVQLADAGLDVVVWEKRDSTAPFSRAIGIHAPALVALDRVGVADPVLAEAAKVRRGVASCAGSVLGAVSFDRAHPRYPFVAALPQSRTEALLADRLATAGPHVLRRGVELVALRDTGDHVQVTGSATAGTVRVASTASDAAAPGTADRGVVREGSGARVVVEESARFVVGADGARSAVRELLGLSAPVREYDDTYVMGDFADTRSEQAALIHLEAAGVVESFPLPGHARRFVVHTPHPATLTAPWLADLVTARTGYAVDPSSVSMLSAFGVRRRFASRMVQGRVALVGDAAHEISPIGGQGMNLGWLDAAMLAPLLVAGARSGVSGAPDPAGLRALETRRTASARHAARQAEVNMALGRPVRGPRLAARNAALRIALRSPTRRVLASAYAMRWS